MCCVNRRGTEPYARWCERTAGVIPPPTRFYCRSEVVKGCKMPAPSRRPVSLHANSTGRRLTSLKGGNRGRQPRGQGRSKRYGDLSGDSSVWLGKITHHRYANAHRRVSCITLAAVFLLTVDAKERIFVATAKRCPYRNRPVMVR